MSLLPKKEHPNCPPAYGDCKCRCHSIEGVKHCIPCCYASKFESSLFDDWLFINKILDEEKFNNEKDQTISGRDAKEDSDT